MVAVGGRIGSSVSLFSFFRFSFFFYLGSISCCFNGKKTTQYQLTSYKSQAVKMLKLSWIDVIFRDWGKKDNCVKVDCEENQKKLKHSAMELTKNT